MDDEDFKSAARWCALIIGGIMGAMIALYLIIVAGWAAHAYINQIDPDPPSCNEYIKDNDGYWRKFPHPIASGTATVTDAGPGSK